MTLSSKSFAAAVLALTLIPAASFAATKSVSTTTSTQQQSYVSKSSFADALSGFYVAGQIGWNHPVNDELDLDNTASFSGAVGYHINPNFRLEGEVSYRKNDYSTSALGVPVSGNVKDTNYMVNGWYDFANASRFTPYVGGGIGLATGAETGNALGTTFKDHDYTFAYQLGAGVAYDLTKNIALTADYRFEDTANFSDLGGDYTAHEIRGGVRYSF